MLNKTQINGLMLFRHDKWQPFDRGNIQDAGWLWPIAFFFIVVTDPPDNPFTLYWLVVLLGAAVLAWVTFFVFGRWGQITSKFYFVQPHVAELVIKKVLQQNSLPYIALDEGFEVGNGALLIHFREAGIGRRRSVRGTQIRLGPTTADNEILIYSLQHHLDEAFLPSGLF
jgi:hypothetical protein